MINVNTNARWRNDLLESASERICYNTYETNGSTTIFRHIVFNYFYRNATLPKTAIARRYSMKESEN